MYNGGFRSNKRTPDGVGTVAAQAVLVAAADPQPTITGWSIQGSDDRALDPAGGQTVVVKGNGFTTGMTVTVGTTAIGAVTINSSIEASFTAPAKTAGNYTLTMANANGQAAILVPGLAYSTVVTWTTPAGSLGTTYETAAFAESVVATADSSITYTLASGSLPTNATLNSNGTITGTANVTASPTTYSFSVTATDAELQDSTQSFTITVAPDAVTWVSPPNGTSYSLTGNQAMANVTLSATSAAGSGITYTANALPTGVSLTGNVIYGTPTVAETVSTLLTATANTTTRSSTETITWTVSVGDIYWPNVLLLLNGSTPTTTFINDASLNNNQLTIAGDTKPNLFSPYRNGYYSNYFDNNGDYLSIASTSSLDFSTGDFTVEAWVYMTTYNSGTYQPVFSNAFLFYIGSAGQMLIYDGTTDVLTGSSGDVPINQWAHVAWSRASGITKAFVNGIQKASTAGASAAMGSASPNKIGNYSTVYFPGYISNLRVIKGQSLYTTAFTPSTTPLTTTSQGATAVNVSLLTCQSNRLIDNSVNNFAITKNGDTTVSSAYPFATPTTSSYNTQYSTYFDGTGDWLTAPDNASLDLGSSNFTIEGWFYQTGNLSTSTGGTGLVTKWTDASNQRGWQFSVRNAAGTMTFYYSTTGSDFPVVTFNSVGLTINTWTHLALVRTGNTLNLYKDGSLAGTSAFSSTIYDNTSPLAIGAWFGGTAGVPDTAGGNTLFQGVISNVRVVKGVAVYTGTFTPPTSPLAATQSSGTNISAITGTQTSLLTCQNSTLIDNSTNAFAITSNGQAQPIATSPFTMTTSTNTLTSLGSAYFDGTGDYVSVPSTAGGILDLTTASTFTVEAWVYIPSLATEKPIISNRPTATSAGWALRVNTTGTAQFYFTGGSTLTTSSTVVVNAWNHIVATRSGANVSIYINGVSGGSSAIFSNGTNTSNAVLVGASAEGAGVYFTGYITDVRVVNGTVLYTSNFLPPQLPLTPVTNTQLLTCQYNGGANNNGFVDQSSFNNLITRAGNTTQGTFSPYSQTGWSNYFNGSTDSFTTASSLPAIALSANYTIEMWVNPATLSANTDYWVAMYNNTGGSGAWGLTLYGQAGSLTATVRLWMTDFSAPKKTTTLTVALNRWSHIAVVRNSGVNTIYVNGVADSSYSSSISILTNTVSVGYYSPSSNGYYNGYISNLRIVNGTAVYTTNFTPSTTPLTATTSTNLLTCQSNRFIDNSSGAYALTLAGTPIVQAYSPFSGTTSTPISYSNYFDGTGDYLNTPSTTSVALASSDFTIELWFNTSAKTNLYPVILSNGNFGAGKWQLDDRHNTNSPTKLIFGVYNAQTAPGWLVSTTAIQNNTWYHVAIVRSGSTFTMYINGTAEATQTYAGAVDAGTAQTVYVGQDAGQAGTNYNGYVSNLRITKGVAVYTGNFTTPTLPLAATQSSGTNISAITGTQTSLLTCQSSTIVDNSTNYFAITANGDTKPKPYNPFGVTNTSAVSYTPSVNGGSMYFDGTGDYLSTAATQIMPATTTYTLEAWVYPTSLPAAIQTIMSQGTSGNAARITMYLEATSGILKLQTGASNINSSTAIPINTWTHVAFVNNAGSYKVFVNGISVASGSNAIVPQTTAFSIGGFGASSTEPFFGYISDVRVTPVALYTSNFYPGSAPAIPTTTIGATTYSSTLLLNGTSGGIIDYHSSNDLETVGNTQLAPQDPYGGSYYSNYFDGTGDYLTAPSNAVYSFGTGDFTVECWVYYPPISNTNGKMVLDVRPTATNGSYWNLGTSNTGVMSFTSMTTGGTTITDTTARPNQWVHYAATRQGTSLKLFANGVLVASATDSSNISSSGIRIGMNAFGATATDTYWLGYISNVRIVKGTALYTSAFAPSTTPLTTTSQGATASEVSLLTCQSNKFVDNSTNAFAITANGDTKVQSQNPFQNNSGKSMYFDGTGDYLLLSQNTNYTLGTGDFTIECWVYFNSLSSGGQIFDFRPASTNGVYPALYVETTGVLYYYVSAANQITGATMITGQWYYVALARSSGVTKLFVNGTQSGSNYADTNNYIVGAGRPIIGGNGYLITNYLLNGYMKDFRITKGVARYTTTFTPPASPDQSN